jgi:hypothetical protein
MPPLSNAVSAKPDHSGGEEKDWANNAARSRQTGFFMP